MEIITILLALFVLIMFLILIYAAIQVQMEEIHHIKCKSKLHKESVDSIRATLDTKPEE